MPSFDELMALYMQSGGGAMAPLYGGGEGAMQEQMMPVQLPDGRVMMPTAGGFQFINPGSSSAPGGMQTGSFTGADGASNPFQYQNPEEGFASRYGLPLVGGLALGGLGLAAAGALPGVAGIGGAAGGAGSAGAAAGGLSPEIAAAMASAGGDAGLGTGGYWAGLGGGAATSMTPEIAAAMAGAGGTASYGAAPAVAGAAGTVANMAGSGAGFPGEGAVSGIPAWDSATGSGAQGSPSGIEGAIRRLVGGGGPAEAAGGFDYSRLIAPLLGAGAAIAGNDDMTSSSNTAGTSSSTSAGTSGSTGSVNSSSQNNSSNSLAPWLQGYAQDYVGRAQQLANGPTSNQFLDRAGGLLMGATDDPLVQQARAQQQNVIDGGLLGGNPFFEQVQRGVADRMGEGYATGTRGALTSGAQLSGNDPRYSSAYQQTVGNADRAFGDSLGQTLGSMSMNNWNTERAAQDAASRNSLAFGSFNQNVANNLGAFGADAWMRPYQQNQMFGSAINPAFGSQSQNASNMTGNTNQTGWTNQNTTGATNSTNTQTIQAPNNWMAGAGGALSGVAIDRLLRPQQQQPAGNFSLSSAGGFGIGAPAQRSQAEIDMADWGNAWNTPSLGSAYGGTSGANKATNPFTNFRPWG
jgi:hypothetical protein